MGRLLVSCVQCSTAFVMGMAFAQSNGGTAIGVVLVTIFMLGCLELAWQHNPELE